ncbi:MAG: hypothetical protein JW811_01425 [Clostridiales bacterium]|nr:hypothetical protein [Clostridiales bacterium]
MPDYPALPVPDYAELNRKFRDALMNPDNEILRYAPNGHPIFGAYLKLDSNELVTWGILAVGEWLAGRDAGWIAVTYADFFVQETGLYMNSPGSTASEFWYLFYVNTLAGAVLCTLYPNDMKARERIGSSADAMKRMAEKVRYDFNHQGYLFDKNMPFTDRPEFRQPDSIAGYAYNMLFAALKADRPQYLSESVRALGLYQAFAENPWYEIPNGSEGLMAASWLNAHGHALDVKKMAGWVFDYEHGPMQTGKWGDEEIDGLMMGWRGETRQLAMRSAYSMETLMPIQFLLPSVRYCPALADTVAKFVRCVLSNFQLFYADGSKPLYETQPELTHDIPYEKLVREMDGRMPAACGDFCGARSVYGAGYLYWLEALARPTDDPDIFALDLSLTDWLADRKYPVFLLRNPAVTARTVRFAPASVWQTVRPELYTGDDLACVLWELPSGQNLGKQAGSASLTVPPGSTRIAALLPEGLTPVPSGGFRTAGGAELIHIMRDET